MKITKLIGEAIQYDKKQMLETKKPKSWCKSISAFANGSGGCLIFGITNADEVVGLANAEQDAERMSEIIKERLNPIPNFLLKFHQTEDGKKLIVLEVYSGDQTPYYYEADGMLTAFYRLGNQSVPVTPAKLKELVLKGSGASFDSLKSKFKFEDMAFTKLKSTYYQRTGTSFEVSDYESFGIVDEDGALTNAGALLADESPVRHSRLFCTRWNGLDKAPGTIDAIDDKEYTGAPHLAPEFNSDHDSFLLVMKSLNEQVIKTSDKNQMIKSGDKKAAIKSGDKKAAIKTEQHMENIRLYLAQNAGCKTSEIASHLSLSVTRTKEILAEMPDVLSSGANRNRTYSLVSSSDEC